MIRKWLLKLLGIDDWCGGHHYTEYEDVDEVYKSQERTYVWRDGEFKGWQYGWDLNLDKTDMYTHWEEILVVMQKQEKECLHSGCDELVTRHVEVKPIPRQDIVIRTDGMVSDGSERYIL